MSSVGNSIHMYSDLLSLNLSTLALPSHDTEYTMQKYNIESLQ